MRRSGRILLLAMSLPAGAVVYSASQAAPAESALLPAGKGAEITQKLCAATCHTADSFNGLRRSAADWNDTVAVMIAYGAQIDSSQTTEVVRYLGQVFGPNSPPLLDVNRAGRTEFEKLPGLDTGSVEALLNYRERRGRFESLNQLRELIGADKFENIKGYVIIRKPNGA